MVCGAGTAKTYAAPAPAEVPIAETVPETIGPDRGLPSAAAPTAAGSTALEDAHAGTRAEADAEAAGAVAGAGPEKASAMAVFAAGTAARRWRRRACGCGRTHCKTTVEGKGLDALVHAASARGERTGGVSFYGDVCWVIEGNAPPDPLAKRLDAGSFRFAFQAGTTAPAGDDAAIGEMVAFGGKAYVRSTRLGAPEYFTTVHAPDFRTPAAGIIYPADAVPDAVLSVQRGGRSFLQVANDLYAHIARSCDAPAAAFGGLVTFRKLHGIAISRSATQGENIIENVDKYYSKPAYEENNVRCVVVGFIADMQESKSRGISGLDAVLYEEGGGDADMPLCLHVHLVTLKPGCAAQTVEEVQPEDVEETLHLSTISIVESMELEAWAITEPLHEHPAVE